MSLCYKPFQNLFPPFESANGIVPVVNGIWIKRSPTLGLNAEPEGCLSWLCREAHLTLSWSWDQRCPGYALHRQKCSVRGHSREAMPLRRHMLLLEKQERVGSALEATSPPFHSVTSVAHNDDTMKCHPPHNCFLGLYVPHSHHSSEVGVELVKVHMSLGFSQWICVWILASAFISCSALGEVSNTPPSCIPLCTCPSHCHGWCGSWCGHHSTILYRSHFCC